MIELVFKCHDCGVAVSHCTTVEEIEQVEECPFCGGNHCMVYLEDIHPEKGTRWTDVQDLLVQVRESLQIHPNEKD